VGGKGRGLWWRCGEGGGNVGEIIQVRVGKGQREPGFGPTPPPR
jgi:hypothetical protein